MRITFVLPGTGLSGGTRVLAIYAERLHRRGHVVNVVSHPWRKRTLLRKLISLLRGRGWPKKVEREPSFFDGLAMPHRVLQSDRPVTDSDVPDADVVIATWWKTAESVSKLSPLKGAKVYFIQHYELFDYTPHKRVKATWRLPLYKITIAKWLAELAKQEYGDRKVWLVPNSVDTNQFYALPRSRQLQPTVGLLYSTTKWKGVDVSLKAFELAAKRVPELRLIAFGAEPVAEWLPLPAGASFHYRPAQESIRDLYASCDVWLCASYSEGFGLPLLEAMACRCPVVSTNAGGPADFIQSGYNGYIVPVGNAEALAGRLVDVLALDEAKWRAMSDAALRTATRYTWDDATDLLEAALGDVIRDARHT